MFFGGSEFPALFFGTTVGCMTASLALTPARAAVALLSTIGLVACLTACDDSKKSTAGPAPSTVTSTMTAASGAGATGSSETTPSAPNAGMRTLGSANTNLKTQRPGEPSQLVVTAIRVGTHEGIERVVFEFTGSGEPGWFIDYTDNPVQQGSGNPVTFVGDTALNINIDGTTYPFEVGIEDPQLETVPGTGSIVTEVQSIGTFEGRSQFVVGINGSARPYSVQALNDPPRLVLDISS